MIRQVCAVAFVVLISTILFANAERRHFTGGFTSVSKDEYQSLITKLQAANLGTALPDVKFVTVVKIISAKQQVVAGTKYQIFAYIFVNGTGHAERCCFTVHENLQNEFLVEKAVIGANKCE